MPSFDIVSKIDSHELQNAIDQANKEVTSRYDIKGTDSKFSLSENTVTMHSESEFQLEQMSTVLISKVIKRGIDSKCMEFKDPTLHLKDAKQDVEMNQGISKEIAKKIQKEIKESKLKVQAQIQGEELRVTSKSRNDLQSLIALLKASKSFDIPLQFINFRD